MEILTTKSQVDPGNYATDVAAGATYEYRLLFIVLLANIFAIFLQTLCIKLGTVTGLNLAECCRAFLPRWLNLVLYIFAEVAIIATDIAEVSSFAFFILSPILQCSKYYAQSQYLTIGRLSASQSL